MGGGGMIFECTLFNLFIIESGTGIEWVSNMYWDSESIVGLMDDIEIG